MDRPSATSTWTCPSCRRLVPARVEQCRCGVARETAPAGLGSPDEEPRRGLSLGEATGLLVMVAAAVVGYRGMRAGSTSPPANVPASLPARVVPAVPAERPTSASVPRFAMPAPSAEASPPSSGFHFEMPPLASGSHSERSATASVAGAADSPPSPSPMSDVDAARAEGRQKLEAAIHRVASLGVEMVRYAQHYDLHCRNTVAADPVCAQVLARIGALAVAVGAGLDAAEDAARTSWLPPGEVRAMRERYGLDAAVWDEIVRVTRQFRR